MRPLTIGFFSAALVGSFGLTSVAEADMFSTQNRQ